MPPFKESRVWTKAQDKMTRKSIKAEFVLAIALGTFPIGSLVTLSWQQSSTPSKWGSSLDTDLSYLPLWCMHFLS